MKTKPKLRKCRNRACRKEFMPMNALQVACCLSCALVLAKAVTAKKEAAQAKLDRATHRAAKQKLKKYPKLVAELQAAFNAFIRERDRYEPCISCGDDNPPDLHGGQWDAGHFLSVGAHPELRFEEDNCHKQCKVCNAGSKYPHKAVTVLASYEKSLVQKIGQPRVDWLKGPHGPLKLSRDELERLTVLYRAKTRELKKSRREAA